MPSRFGWVDVTEAERQRMMDIIKILREQDTRDELGIGSIRDAFANCFFPGTSTIQTRARYMLFVPWIYLSLKQRRVGSLQVAQRARSDEIRLIYALLQSDDTDGLIGKEAKDKLQRLPSSVYWSGLGSWGIRLFPGSQEQYHRFADVLLARQGRIERDDDGEPVDGGGVRDWDPGLPESPPELLERADLTLTPEEAHYLRDRILLAHPQTLLAFVLRHGQAVEADFVWEHPVMAAIPEELRRSVTHAQNVSETMYGSVLLYNWMLAVEAANDPLREGYRQALSKWRVSLQQREGQLRAWYADLGKLWTLPALKWARIPESTKRFVNDWLALVFSAHTADDLLDHDVGKQLIRHREVSLKGQRSRLENRRQLELWTGAAGTFRLDYRWTTARTLSRDILLGLEKRGKHHA